MATKEQLAEWIVANEDKKGTPDFDTVVAAYKELSVEEESISEKAERLREEGEEELRLLQEKETEEPEEEPDIFDQFEEFGKGIFGGATGLLESSALGAVAPLGEGTETAAREGILSVSDPVRGFFAADKGSEEIFGRKFGEALGSFLGIGATAVIPIVGIPLAAGLAVTAGAGEASERARAAGATEEERLSINAPARSKERPPERKNLSAAQLRRLVTSGLAGVGKKGEVTDKGTYSSGANVGGRMMRGDVGGDVDMKALEDELRTIGGFERLKSGGKVGIGRGCGVAMRGAGAVRKS